MEKKMAKFIAIQLTDYQEVNKNYFDKFTTTALKKMLKCEKVMQLKYNAKSNSKAAEFADVADYKLNQLVRTLTSTYFEDMTENRYAENENTKIFIISDDASSTALAFDVLTENYSLKIFELDDDEITNFIHSIETIQSADDSISSLEEAKELCESLSTIEADLGLSLLHRSATDEIDEKISDIESDVETSNETLEEIFEAKWG
jgi:hypothetical protein